MTDIEPNTPEVPARVAIDSQLVKTAQLAFFSQQFPLLVRAACMLENKPYNEPDTVMSVAATPGIAKQIPYYVGESIDEGIIELYTDPARGLKLDQDIRYCVKNLIHAA